jgi:hypothetical protein
MQNSGAERAKRDFLAFSSILWFSHGRRIPLQQRKIRK